MDDTTYYQRNKKRLREQARNKYRSLSEEDKNKKREYGKNRYNNMSEEARVERISKTKISRSKGV